MYIYFSWEALGGYSASNVYKLNLTAELLVHGKYVHVHVHQFGIGENSITFQNFLHSRIDM
jgi:hypothetical protein